MASWRTIRRMRVYSFSTPSLPASTSAPPHSRKDWEGFLAAYPGALHAEVADWKTEAEGNLAYGHGVFRTTGPGGDGNPLDLTVRVTDVYRKANGKWLVVHEHVSWPVDLATGKADLSSKP